jgi:hypothetical protein
MYAAIGFSRERTDKCAASSNQCNRTRINETFFREAALSNSCPKTQSEPREEKRPDEEGGSSRHHHLRSSTDERQFCGIKSRTRATAC